MTFLSWISPGPPRSLLNLHRDDSTTAHDGRLVPPEYLPLHRYLHHRYASMVVLSFEQIESLVGFALPATAATDLTWWTGGSATAPHTEAWRVTGRCATPNLLARNVTFERVS